MKPTAAGRSPIGIVVRLVFTLAVLVAFSYGADWALRVENFPVQHVYFEGPFKRVQHRELEAAVLEHVRGNFFLIDLDTVQQRVEALPWVHRATVRRRFPNDIAVLYTEERLAAHWTDGAWVNTSGEVVRVTGTDLPADLPRLAGPEGTSAQALQAYVEFQETLASLKLTLTSLTLTPRRSWRLELEGNDAQRLTLLLDHEQPRNRLERFARVFQTTFAAQPAAIRQVDLRYTNGFAVEWRPGSAPAHATNAAIPRNEG